MGTNITSHYTDKMLWKNIKYYLAKLFSPFRLAASTLVILLPSRCNSVREGGRPGICIQNVKLADTYNF